MDSDYPTKPDKKARGKDAVAAHRPPPSEPAAVDRALERLTLRAPVLAAMPGPERARRLLALLRRLHEVGPRMVELDCAAKGIDPKSPLAGEPAFDGPAIIARYARSLASTLSGKCRVGPESARVEGGRTVVDLMPRDGYERLLFPGWSARGLFTAEVQPERLATHPSELVSQPPGVALVLGAGNVASIGVVDALQQVFALGRACVLKVSPVNDYLGPVLELSFAPLVAEGFFAFAYGGRELGEHLVAHPRVTHVHVTGAAETHDAIVWGAAEGRAARKARNEPVLKKPVTSELGNVSPVIVLPGSYSDRELSHAARSIVGSHVFNAGFNCNATKLVVTPSSPLRDRLLEEMARVYEGIPPRVAYYPGAEEKYRRFTGAGRLRTFGASDGRVTPWAFVTDLTPQEDAACFRDEPFCAVLSEVSLGATDPLEFMDHAARFVNERVFGTLNAMVVAPASVESDATTAAALERMLGELRYGAICVNVWPAASYGVGTLPWGGHPSGTLADPQSGVGWGHNALLLGDDIEKTVLRAPLLPLVKPLWYPGHRTLDQLARRFADFSAAPGPMALLRVAAAALRG